MKTQEVARLFGKSSSWVRAAENLGYFKDSEGVAPDIPRTDKNIRDFSEELVLKLSENLYTSGRLSEERYLLIKSTLENLKELS